MFSSASYAHQQATGDRGGTSARHAITQLAGFPAFQGIQLIPCRRHDRGAVLVIVEYRDIAPINCIRSLEL